LWLSLFLLLPNSVRADDAPEEVLNGLLRINYDPPEEYDFVIEFTRESGRDQVFQVFRAVDAQFRWSMGSWGKDLRLSTGKRTLAAGEDPSCTDNGKLFRSVVHVRKQGIEVRLNGRRVAAYDYPAGGAPDAEKFDRHGMVVLGVGAWFGARTTFSRIELIPVTK
jgi:hypothetical protein